MSLRVREALEKIDLNFYFIYLVGAAGFAVKAVRPLMSMLTPGVLFLTAAYALARTYYENGQTERKVFLFWACAVFTVTMVLEALGVRYGLFFGEYDYGSSMGPALFGVPLIIGVNWLIVITAATALMKTLTRDLFLAALGAGCIAFVFDFVLEPAAIALGFWDWAGPIPIKNYISWFVITFVFSLTAGHLKLDISKKWAPRLLGAQFIFFVFIRILMAFNLF